MSYETEKWPVIKARWFTKLQPAQKRIVRVIVIHDMEAPETSNTAENVAKYFATTTTQASAHVCIDNNSVVQCVMDNDVAWAAPGANSDGIQIELAGYGKQSRGDWLDDYSEAMLKLAADVVAQYCLKYSIPPVHLTNAQLASGAKGIVGHVQVSQVYKKSTHTDPGVGFPWDYFICLAARQYDRRRLAA